MKVKDIIEKFDENDDVYFTFYFKDLDSLLNVFADQFILKE